MKIQHMRAVSNTVVGEKNRYDCMIYIYICVCVHIFIIFLRVSKNDVLNPGSSP